MTLTECVRKVAEKLEFAGPESICAIVEPLRSLVKPNVHLGRKDLVGNEMVEWYAGQLLDIVDNKSWFAVNSWLNCVDKFAPTETE